MLPYFSLVILADGPRVSKSRLWMPLGDTFLILTQGFGSSPSRWVSHPASVILEATNAARIDRRHAHIIVHQTFSRPLNNFSLYRSTTLKERKAHDHSG